MRAPLIPDNESLRLASLYRTGLLEGFAEHRIKALTELASRMLGRPAAALSLLSSERQLLRAGVNLKLTSTTRDESFCGHAILQPDRPMVVEDALLDPRFADNPMVTARRLPIRFYAGVPVRTDEGYPVGALCVFDHVPGTISDADLQVLRKIAEEIELIISQKDSDTAEYSSLLTELQQALVMDDLLLQWQAVSDLKDRRVVGHEALVRWARADGTMMKPDQFIPLATTSGLMTRLDRFVLHAACAEAAALGDGGGISVNVSGNWLGLERAALAEIVAQTLDRTGLPPDCLTIEMAEGAIARDPARALQEMQELKAAGVRLALDNFGTGMSAMRYVETYPFDMLKLDKAVVGEIGRSPRAESIVYSVISIAHELGKSVCAVGVETEQQLAFLRDENCDLIQGRLVDEPTSRLRPVERAV
ncbi:sensor domain-containing phosphodiesterase [Lichenicoccus roseus]|uniref:EAL domain-containing protein n=1 Tax=Lichenicoccus roseus TaxID=2683649 RepID=A0A5R9JES5_9PROT|nr:EAL domain-containing protein [Lichenicoccus roseus]TLU72808.1 EAL domain-containing protein [Lichenicoccus roseus]